MKPFALVLVGIVLGWAASGVDWPRNAVGQEASIITERLAPPEAVATAPAEPMMMAPFLPQMSGRFQIASEAGACYRLDTVTGRVWHITLHMKPRVVAEAVEMPIMQ
ncbi:hypothetical protein [Lacipirellula parvula]|uniref:Uncharacterized protein n=1 Tax=Lacipirellula parvula TaxID=2650471 RepID=A0A5K7XKQ8_9BACT|nr:hypothetical protein [Lacipirellula parvula]BBO33549.1 hypothetical protein PLANPX_3161 [Lacipirellula parvula]